MSAIFPDKKDIESLNYSRTMEEQEMEKQFMKKLLKHEGSKVLSQLGYRDPLSHHFEFIVDDLIKRDMIIELPEPYDGRFYRRFIATRRERLEELLERIEANENEWCDWLNLSNYYYERHLWDKFIICMKTVEKILGNSFESTIRLKDKKQLAWGYIHKARELLNNNTDNLITQNKTNFDYSGNRKKAKELYYKASKIYTNFYSKQPKKVPSKHYTFGHKDLGQIPYGKRYQNINEMSYDTYEMIEDVPIYYIILRDLYHTFGITYEELTQDIKNKLL
jgi:hypothetical protein